MAITKQKKEKIIADLNKKISESNFLIFSDFTGLSAVEVGLLKKNIEKAEAKNKVAKKTLINIALKKAGLKDKIFDEILKGQIAVTFDSKNPLGAAKANRDFSRAHPNFKILGGIFENQFISAEDVKRLGSIPSKDALYAQLAGMLNNIIGRFVYVVSAISGKK